MQENRNDRLARDYREMLKIQNRPYLSWIVTRGEPPYAEEYLLSISLRTYALTAESGKYIVGAIERCAVRIRLWDSYPYTAPNIRMLSLPPVFHPDWYSKGTYSPPQPWRPEDSLKDYVLRMLESLRWEPSAITSGAPANYKALDWYQRNRDNGAWFPSDPITLSENTDDEARKAEQAAVFGEIIDSWGV